VVLDHHWYCALKSTKTFSSKNLLSNIAGATMSGGSLHLRRERQTAHRSYRLPLIGGFLVVVVGAACFEPLAPTVLAPLSSAPSDLQAVPAPAPVAPIPVPVFVPPAAPAARADPVVVPPAPTMAPLPTSVPTLTASAQDLLVGIRGDLTARWLKNHAETPLRSGPNLESQTFTTLPQWSTLRVVESQPDWFLVQYGGDGATRQAGPGWVSASDVGGVDAPAVWLSSTKQTVLWGGADSAASRALDVPRSALMEVIGPEVVSGTRVHVRLPGDGRSVPPAQGWIDGDALARTRAPGYSEVPRAYPAILAADVRLRVPYRTQLDGSDFESANCGPTTLGMALEAFGVYVPQADLRFDVLQSEEFDTNDNDAGSFIWALAQVARTRGLRTYGLYEGDGETLHRWSIDDVRASVRQGRPVIAQVVYRGLPGREDSEYYGDHYVVITGLMGEDFIYNDPIGGARAKESPGWDRIMTSDELRRAMRASDRPYAFTAFSLSRP
jgi:hypothetical protein